MTLTPKDYKSEVKPTWCPGCGDFGVLNAIYNSMAGMKLAPDQTVVVSGIGCSSRLPHFVQTFGFHSLHGRALPVAQGLKMARPDLTVVAVGGDGDLFSIGVGHLIHAALRNIDITVVAMDNETYGLTKGQTSPTTPIPADHDAHNRFKAMELSMETEKPFVGLFYQDERQTMDEAAHQLAQQAKPFDINTYMKRFT